MIEPWCENLSLWCDWLFGLTLHYEINGFESRYSHLSLRYSACSEQGVPWYSRKFRLNTNSIHVCDMTKIYIQSQHKDKFVGNKAKGWISKRVFQENKASQIFLKTNISYPLIRIRTCAYQGVRNVRFLENLACFVFLKYSFWNSPFCLITGEFSQQILIIWLV